MAARDKRPLLSYLKVQEHHEREMMFTLKRSVARMERELVKLEHKPGIGAQVRRNQIRATMGAIHREIASYWRLAGSEIKAGRAEAAATAAESMFTYERDLWGMVKSKTDVDTLLRASKVQAARTVEVVETRMLGYSRIPLSQRVYKSQQLITGQIDRVVDHALARGSSARELAADVRQFIRMDTPGGPRYAAMRLARTELNNAFHATQVRSAVQAPWVEGMRWNLSGSHPRPDECNEYADIGVYAPDEVPAKPHPNCLCYMTPEVVSRKQFIAQFEAGEYDQVIDKIMRDGGMNF